MQIKFTHLKLSNSTAPVLMNTLIVLVHLYFKGIQSQNMHNIYIYAHTNTDLAKPNKYGQHMYI